MPVMVACKVPKFVFLMVAAMGKIFFLQQHKYCSPTNLKNQGKSKIVTFYVKKSPFSISVCMGLAVGWYFSQQHKSKNKL